jgi:hypothetical protein
MNTHKPSCLQFLHFVRAGFFQRFLPCIVLSLALTCFARPGPANFFNNGEVTERVKWLDTDGNLIKAHDGGILFVEGRYYWYGMELRLDWIWIQLSPGQVVS